MIDTDFDYPEAGEHLRRVRIPRGPDYRPAPAGDFVVAYKQQHIPTADWYRNSSYDRIDAAMERVIGLIDPVYPYIVRIAVFTLAIWNYGKPTGLPLHEWMRDENGAWLEVKGE